MPLKQFLLSKPRDLKDPGLFHKISLVAFLAWVGLGADGLSSSAYGPDEAYRALMGHPQMAVFLVLATAATVFLISYAYSLLIEHFPHGGGGYVVTTKLLGPSWGVVSGSALLVDYVLTITTSVAAAMDQVFSFLPLHLHGWKLPAECFLILVLIVMNLRGVKESVQLVVPIFMLFILTHAVVLMGCLVVYGNRIPEVATHAVHALKSDVHQLGLWGMFLIFMNAYSRGAGTYTGIEAVSNGVLLMREPRVKTARKTMAYMASSLAITAGGILVCYLLAGVSVEEGKTLNAVLVERIHIGPWFVVLTLLAEAGLLMVAAQAGFLDGPRVMANMSLDGWLPRLFSSLSEQLTMHYGVLLMGLASMGILFYSHGDITTLVTMYSINVFVTFSLSQIAMCRMWLSRREKKRTKALLVHGSASFVCVGILAMVVFEKFTEGGWITLLVTLSLVGFCFLIRRHYRAVQRAVGMLSSTLTDLPRESTKVPEDEALDGKQSVAVLLVSGYGGLGIHTLLTILKLFPGQYRQVIFASAAVIDSGTFKGRDELEHLQAKVRDDLTKYKEMAGRLGLSSEIRMELGTDPVAESERMCDQIARQFPKAVFFGGKLIFQRENWYHRLLHNETATAIQRRLHWMGVPMIILPIRVGT